MGRSQRHMLWEQGETAAGEIHAQGVVAPGIAVQVDPQNPNVLKPGAPLYNTGLEWKSPPDMSNVEVPIGEPGGPLSGSSLTGAIPESLVTDPGPGGELRIIGFNPNDIPAGFPDMSVVVIGEGFIGGAVVVMDGVVLDTEFLSDNQLRFICPSSTAVVGPVPVIVRQGAYETEPVDFNFVEATRATGPLNILRIDNDNDGLLLEIDGGEFKVGDKLLVEATGNTSVNGSWTVIRVEGTTIVIDNDFELTNIIEAKGRVTINEEAE